MTLTIHLLNQFALTHNGNPIESLHTPRLQALLSYLLLHREAPQPRERIAHTLWPESEDSNARNNLRRLLHRLRQNLPLADDYLEITAHTVQWRPPPTAVVWLDVATFEDACHTADTLETWHTAGELYAGPLLPHLYDDWLWEWRERLYQQWLTALQEVAARATAVGETELALDALTQLIENEPLHETHYQDLMRLYQAQGNRGAALRVYERCVQTLRDELGVPPSAVTRDLHRTLLQDEARQNQFAPPTPSYPKYQTPLFGREAQLDQLTHALWPENIQLLTVTGTGGIGKTRLVAQVAHHVQDKFPHGVVFLSLASVPTADLLVPTLASALNLTLSGQQPPLHQLIEALQGRHCLLVLDNFEHLMAGRHLLGRLVQATPTCRWLIASRERLNLRAEAVFDLDGLRRPRIPYDGLAHTWETYPAVRLFITAAQRARLDFVPQAEDWPLIGQICDLTNGHPLALELAASWRRYLSCGEIVQRLHTTADLPEVATQDLPPRQRSLTATFDYSWELLTPEEQAALLRLAVFKGPFRADAAADIADVSLAQLITLVDKSLLQLANADLFDSHPLLRQYMQSKLATQADVSQRVTAVHAAYYQRLVNQQADALREARRRGENPRAVLEMIRTEIDNVRAAWQWLQQMENRPQTDEDTAVFITFVDNFGLFLAFESWYQEAQTLYTTALEAITPDTLTAGRWQRQLAIAHLGLGDAPRAEAYFRRSLALLGYSTPEAKQLRPALLWELLHQVRYRLLPVRRPLTAEKRAAMQEVIKTYDSLSRVHYYRGQTTAFAHSAVRALNLAERLDEKPVLARHYANLCMGLAFVGRHRWSRAYRARALTLAAELDDAPSQAYAYLVTGVYDGMVGAWETSQRSLRQARQIYEQLGDVQQWGECQAIICTNLYAQGQFHTAVPEWEKLIARAHTAGNRLQRSWGNTGLTGALLILDDTERIPDLLHTSRATLSEIQSPQNMMTTQAFWGAYQARQGAWRAALDAADTVWFLAQENRTTFTTIVVALGSTCEVYLDLLALDTAQLHQAGGQQDDLRRKLDTLTKQLLSFSKSVTAGYPRAALYRGLYLVRTDAESEARRLFRKGLAKAEALHMPYDAARLQAELALLAGDMAQVQVIVEDLAALTAVYDAERYRKQATR